MALLLHCNILIYISPTNNQGTIQPNIVSMCYHEVGLEVRIPIWKYTQRIIWNITFKKTHGLHEWVNPCVLRHMDTKFDLVLWVDNSKA